MFVSIQDLLILFSLALLKRCHSFAIFPEISAPVMFGHISGQLRPIADSMAVSADEHQKPSGDEEAVIGDQLCRLLADKAIRSQVYSLFIPNSRSKCLHCFCIQLTKS